MSTIPEARRASGINWRIVALLIASVCVVILITANAHLVYVALDSQPECVPHSKGVGESGAFRAARSSC